MSWLYHSQGMVSFLINNISRTSAAHINNNNHSQDSRYRFQSRRGMIADAVQGCGMWWNKSTATAWCYHVNTEMRNIFSMLLIQCHDGIYKYLLKFLKPQKHFCVLLVFNWHQHDGCWSWWVCITITGDTNPPWSLFKLEWALVLYNAAVTWL